MKPNEIKRYANALVRWHSKFAAAHAARRAAKLVAMGDPSSAAAWHKIEKRITDLQAPEHRNESASLKLVTQKQEHASRPHHMGASYR
jgi:hypothetical protein